MPAILLIEDDPTSQELIRAVCEEAGYEVDAAADGFGALKLMRDRTYAAALVDYHLPEMDGYALARLLRDVQRDESAALRMVGITSDANGLAARRGAQELFDIILAKPFAPSALLATLAQLVGSGRLTPIAAAEIVLAKPTSQNARAASDAFWRSRGLAGAPRAFGRPPPSADQAKALALCFDLVEDAASADLVVLLTASASDGPDIRAETKVGDSVPIVDLAGTGRPDCQAAFQVDDPRSWDDVAVAVLRSRCPRDHVEALPNVDLRPGELGENAAIVGAVSEGADEVQLDLGLSVARSLLIGNVAVNAGWTREAVEQAGHLVGLAPPSEPDALMRVAAAGLNQGLVEVAAPVKDGLPAAPPIRMLAAGKAAQADASGDPRTALDTDAFERIGRLIGPDRARSLAVALAAQLNGWRIAVPATPAERERLAQDAHKMVSAAGLLGFTSLSEACRGLEEKALMADDLRPAINRLETALRAATAVISGLKTAA